MWCILKFSLHSFTLVSPRPKKTVLITNFVGENRECSDRRLYLHDGRNHRPRQSRFYSGVVSVRDVDLPNDHRRDPKRVVTSRRHTQTGDKEFRLEVWMKKQGGCEDTRQTRRKPFEERKITRLS